MLVERVIRKLIEEKIDIDKILVVTFTNAAASQMREKILDAIYKKLEEEPGNSHLQKQIVLMNKASISTIHAFCLEVIRNHFYEIGVSPNFRMGDTSELELLKQEVIDDLFDEKYENKDKEFADLIETYTTYRGDENLKELIFRIHKFIMATPFPTRWINEAVDKFNVKDSLEEDFSKTVWGNILLENAKEQAQGFSVELETLASRLLKEGLDKFALVVREDKQTIEDFLKATTWNEAHEKANAISFGNWPTDRKTVSNLKDEAKDKRTKIKESFQSRIESIRLYSSKEAMEDINCVYPRLVELKNLVIEFENKYQDAKKEKNIIDFHDIEHFALNILLKEDEEGNYVATDVAKEYREKYVEIAIDEYQDSNLIQDCILSTISRNDNLFMVGDVKQSIYKFRQARPKLFLDKYEKYSLPKENKNDGLKILLFKNFRSRKEVIDITNKVFQAIMSKKLGEIEYTETEYLNQGAEYEKTEGENISGLMPELHVINTEIEENNDDEIAEEPIENTELEAKLVANKIQELIDQHYLVKDKNGYRPITYKDIVILLRAANTVAQVYEKELMSRQIPTFSDTSTEYLESEEINTVLALLRIIDNPNQDIALVTVLRSPMYRFNDNEFVTIRLKDKKGSFYQALKKASEDEELKDKINFFLNQIEDFRKKQEYMPLHELIWYIYEETGFKSYTALTKNGALKIANLKMLFERAKDYESASYKGLYNFVHYIERMKKNNQDFGAAKIIGENENVVRIMSIHKSKGLEFPVVFLCEMGKGFNFRDLNESVLLHQDIGFGPKYINYSRQIEYDTLAKEAIKEESKTEAISEEMRILYVALTRAKEKLIMIGTQKKAESEISAKKDLIENIGEVDKLPFQTVKLYKTYLDWLEFVFLKDNREIFLHSQKDIEELNTSAKNTLKITEHSVTEDLKEKIKKSLEWEYENKELETIPSKSSVTAIKHNNDEINIDCSLPVPKFLKPTKELTGAEKGTIMHLVLQKLDLKREYTENELTDFIYSLVAKNILTSKEAGSIATSKLMKFIKSGLAEDIRNAKKIYQEKPFYIYLPAKEVYGGNVEEKIVVQGIIDLYYINQHDETILVDYKTDYVTDNNEQILIEKYKVQLQTYARAIEQATGKKVDKIYIYSLYLGKEITL